MTGDSDDSELERVVSRYSDTEEGRKKVIIVCQRLGIVVPRVKPDPRRMSAPEKVARFREVLFDHLLKIRVVPPGHRVLQELETRFDAVKSVFEAFFTEFGDVRPAPFLIFSCCWENERYASFWGIREEAVGHVVNFANLFLHPDDTAIDAAAGAAPDAAAASRPSKKRKA